LKQLHKLRRIVRAALALLLLISGALCAQEYSFRTFGNADGLNNLTVRSIHQDREGFIWVSTDNGIFRYDGDRFEAFGPAQGIPPTYAAAFGEAPDGSLLAGGNFGLYRLRGASFEKLPVSFKILSRQQGIESDGKGHTYIGTDSGLVELYSEAGHDGLAIRTFPQVPATSGPGVEGVLVDGDILWYGCGKELCRMDRDGTRVFGKESGLPDGALVVIRKDREGNLWVRDRNVGVLVLPAGETKFRMPDTPIPGTDIAFPGTDAAGRILLPYTAGLLIREGRGWQKIDRSSGLRGDIVLVLEDRLHSLWIGSAGRGLTQWRGYREWKSYSTASGLPSDMVYGIQPQADGTLWVATEGGLLRGERDQTRIRWKKVAGLSGFPVESVRMAPNRDRPNEDLWIGTQGFGAARYHVATGTVEWFREAQGLLGKQPLNLRFDHLQRLWAATEAGLFVATAPYQRFSRVAELPSTRFWAVAEGSDGSVWAGGVDGLFAYASGQWKNVTRDNGLSNQEVVSLGSGANGTMWIGYQFGGIDHVHLQPGGLAVEKSVQRPGTTGPVQFLEFDASGRLWAGTDSGVDVWNGSRWIHYDTSDGLVWNDCTLNGFTQGQDGTIWIGTSGGLSQYKPSPRLSPEVPIEVVFTKLVMGGKDVSGQNNPSASIQANSLVARYSALNVSNENRTLFRYRLEGPNSGWRETTQRELQFAGMAPGGYRLEIEAQDSDGVWSERKAEFAFRILTPWYSSWWFISICVLTPVLIVGVVARLRMLSAREIERWKIRYEAAVLASGQIIFDWDPVSREVTFGGALQDVLGYSPSVFTGATEKWRGLIHPDDLERYVKTITEAVETKEAFELEYRVRSSKGEYVMMREQGRVVLDERRNVSRMVGFITDVSERRMLEQQLRQAQKMEAVGRLAGGVAHDFNNLLTIIIGYSHILTQELTAGSKPYNATTQIASAASRAAGLTRQLLAFSRQQVLAPRIIDLNSVILNLDSMLRRLIGEDIEILTVHAGDLGTVKADPGQVEQVLINLALNARDAMPNGGKLTLETSNVELDDAYAREHQSAEPGRYVMLAVSDTGVGMSPEIQNHIFEPFYTTKETGKGTGLGLSTVYGIVKQSGGNIWVYSEPGRGTTFKVYFPRMDQPAEKLGSEKGSSQVQRGTETILLVEDDSQLRQLTADLLAHCGYKVLAAGRADEALALCKANHREIELLVTDVVMPGMNGRQLAEQVARIFPQVKVLYISGYTSNAIVHQGVLDTGLWFLPKPFSLSALVARVREVLDASPYSLEDSRSE